MKFRIFIMVSLFIAGCVQQPTKHQGALPSNPVDKKSTETVEVKPKEDPRVAYLKDQSLLNKHKLEKFYEVDSLFAVMKALQDGRLTTDDLSESMFYFNDTDGEDTGYLYNSTYFTCIQVIEMGELENNDGDKGFATYFTDPITIEIE